MKHRRLTLGGLLLMWYTGFLMILYFTILIAWQWLCEAKQSCGIRMAVQSKTTQDLATNAILAIPSTIGTILIDSSISLISDMIK